MPNVRTYLSIQGEIHGAIWQPGCHCAKPISTRVEIIRGAESLPYKGIGLPKRWQSFSVSAAIAEVLNDGDFQAARFTPDTTVEIQREITLPSGQVRSADIRANLSGATFILIHSREVKLSADYVSECEGHDYGEDE